MERGRDSSSLTSANPTCSGEAEMRGLLFCSVVSVLGVLPLSPPAPSMWGISWTKRVKGNNWAWYLEELNMRQLDFRDYQVYKECLQILSLEKVSVSSWSTLTNWQMILKAIRTSAGTVWWGFAHFFAVSSAVSPSHYFDNTDEAILVCVSSFFQPTS